MSFDSILEISRLAMSNEKLRAELSASNIARINLPSSRNTLTAASFSSELAINRTDNRSFSSASTNVNVKDTPETSTDARFSSSEIEKTFQKYEPSNPLADKSGFVTYPSIDLATEFVTLTLAKRAYEANVRVFNTITKMHNKTLELGRA